MNSERTIREIASSLAITRIEQFLRETGMSPSVFGIRSVKCNKIIKRIQSGESVTFGTLDRIEEFMSQERAHRSRSAVSAADAIEGRAEEKAAASAVREGALESA